jgi:excinuclease ABC subunit A
MAIDKIIIKGAAEHNLKRIDVELPRNKLIVFTGISGSGKSSLAFDTIYAEGQRRYVESLSVYARQFLEQMEKPDVESIEGLSPAISIEQRTTSRNPRSTVGTVTEIYDYLRLLFARVGEPHCPQCGKPISGQTVQQIVDQVLALPDGERIQVLAPIARRKKGEFKKELENLRRQGFVRTRIDGAERQLDEEIELDKQHWHYIDVVVDRLVIKEGVANRLAESVEAAIHLADGLVTINRVDGGEDRIFSERLACIDCGLSVPEMSPRAFSFNSPHGACPQCDGLGSRMQFDEEKLVPDPTLSVMEGALAAMPKSESSYFFQMYEILGKRYGFDAHLPYNRLPRQAVEIILNGSGEEIEWELKDPGRGRLYRFRRAWEGVIPWLTRRYKETGSEYIRAELEGYMTSTLCSACGGRRLRPESLSVTVGGHSIADITALSVKEAFHLFEDLRLGERESLIADKVLKEIRDRLRFMANVGLDYLTLDRSAVTLSGGEAQRIRLATQIGSSLMGVLYVLDEPSIGLHQRDNRRLLDALERMRDLGNTVIVVEHDEETIRTADHIVDLGPGAGIHGGYVVCQGTVKDIIRCPESLTGQYLSGARSIPVPEARKEGNGHYLEVRGASMHNLKEIDVRFPLGRFICVTGISGSGKSTLVVEILYKALAQRLHRALDKPGAHREIRGLEHVDKVIDINQSPIGRTPRSNPATYTGLFGPIRELFSLVPEARMRGYKPGRFSFNVKGGRCEACKGDGLIKVEMHFLPDVYVTCDVCKGRRYNRETLEVLYGGKSIADVLEMTVEEALDFFRNVPACRAKLQTLFDVGLGYIELGQSATTLSGGEAQRVKLSKELSRRQTGRTVYLLDEPTTGLHFDDIRKLLAVLQSLVEAGNTVIVIEHNLDVIKTADWVIDLGPEGGDDGGRIVAEGTPEAVARNASSYTGEFLTKVLKLS